MHGTLKIVYQVYHSKQDSLKKKIKVFNRQFKVGLRQDKLSRQFKVGLRQNKKRQEIQSGGRGTGSQHKYITGCREHLLSLL
jgi:hypothetical protein